MYQKTFNECDLSRMNILGFIDTTPFSLTGNVNKGVYFYWTADELSHYKLNNFPLKIVFLLILVFLGGFILQLIKYNMIILPQCNGLPTTTIWYITFHQQVSKNNF